MATNPGEVTQSHWESADAAQAWAESAARRNQQFGPATELMLDLAGVGQGQRVLDVAAGTGEQTLLVAERVGPSGSVLATDISSSMLETALSAVRAAGLANVETRVVDARQMELEPESFDAAISRNGLQWIPNPDAVLRNIMSALRPGGKLAVLVHGAPERNAWAILPATIIRRIGSLPGPTPSEPDNCVLGGPGVLEATLRGAGFRDISVHAVTIERSFPSAAAATVALREGSGYLRTLLAFLTEAQRDQAWAEIEQGYAQFLGHDGVDLSSESLVGVGTK